jgi:multimeric flavodoxin WrbA
VAVRLLRAAETEAADLLGADGYLFACPENLASMSGEMKEFFDRTYYPCLERLNGRPYAAMIAAGSDGAGAARQLARIATGWRLKPVAEPLIVGTQAQTPQAILAEKSLGEAQLAPCRDLGAALAAGLAMGVF